MLTSFAGGSLFGASSGTGRPRVLCLHGWGRTHRDFAGVLEPAGDVPLDAIALDLPGFGSTPPPPAPWRSIDFATALAPVLDEVGEPLVVVGHSHGGRVALCLADRMPDAVAGLVLVGAPVLRPPAAPPALSYRMVRWLHRHGLYSEARMEALRRRRGSADYVAATGVMRDTLVTVVNEDFSDELARLAVPTTLLWGSDDTAVPPAVAEQAAARIAASSSAPAVEVEILPGVGHLVPTEAPAALRAAIEVRLA